MSIVGNMAGCYSPMGKTFILTDEGGNQITGVVTEQEQIFTATDNDVREGFIYASDDGISIGTKIIPSYHTKFGTKKITPGKTFYIRDENYDYNFMQAIVCSYNTSSSDSVAAAMVVINDNVYVAGSTNSIAVVSKDHDNTQINLNITNTTDNSQILRYMFIKEMF